MTYNYLIWKHRDRYTFLHAAA